MKNPLLLSSIVFVVTSSGEPIQRPYFWGTGLDAAGNTIPVSVVNDPPPHTINLDPHWNSVDYDWNEMDSVVWKSSLWSPPFSGWLGQWISREIGEIHGFGRFPHWFDFSLENNFYTNF